MFTLNPITTIDKTTIPEAQQAAIDVLNKVTEVIINPALQQVGALIGDTITELDASANRALNRLEVIVSRLECGLELKGTLGPFPVDLVLSLKESPKG